MKKILFWMWIVAVITILVSLLIMGFKLLDGNYDIVAEGSLCGVCLAVNCVYAFSRLSGLRCGYCGKIIWQQDRYCPHCGGEIKK